MVTLGLGLGFGPRKRQKPFNPASISGLIAWYDANDTSTITQASGSVSQWRDKSGNANHAAQVVGANQPITGTRTINGRNALDFDGSNDWLDLPNALLGLSAATIFTVFLPDDVNQDTKIVSNNGLGGAQSRLYAMNQACDFGTVPLASASPVSGQAVVQMCGAAGGAGTQTQYLRTNNTLVTGSVTRAAVATNFCLGSYSDGTSGFINGAVGEILIWNRDLTLAEKNKIGAYLNKWGVAWTNM